MVTESFPVSFARTWVNPSLHALTFLLLCAPGTGRIHSTVVRFLSDGRGTAGVRESPDGGDGRAVPVVGGEPSSALPSGGSSGGVDIAGLPLFSTIIDGMKQHCRSTILL
jgi:hypothetical protein